MTVRRRGDDVTTEELKRLLAGMSRLPWSRYWMAGAIRHVCRNVDEGAFYDPSGDDPDADANGEINTPSRTDGAAIAVAMNALPALLERVERLETFARDCCNNFDCDRDAHKYGTTCRACSALAALTTEKETPCRHGHVYAAVPIGGPCLNCGSYGIPTTEKETTDHG